MNLISIKEAVEPMLKTEEGLYKLLYVLLAFLVLLICMCVLSWIFRTIKKVCGGKKRKTDRKDA